MLLCRESAERRRQQLNTLIRNYVDQQLAAGDTSIQIISLENELDWKTMTDQRKKRLFDDGLHFTKYGYRELARLMFERLVKVLDVKV